MLSYSYQFTKYCYQFTKHFWDDVYFACQLFLFTYEFNLKNPSTGEEAAVGERIV